MNKKTIETFMAVTITISVLMALCIAMSGPMRQKTEIYQNSALALEYAEDCFDAKEKGAQAASDFLRTMAESPDSKTEHEKQISETMTYLIEHIEDLGLNRAITLKTIYYGAFIEEIVKLDKQKAFYTKTEAALWQHEFNDIASKVLSYAQKCYSNDCEKADEILLLTLTAGKIEKIKEETEEFTALLQEKADSLQKPA